MIFSRQLDYYSTQSGASAEYSDEELENYEDLDAQSYYSIETVPVESLSPQPHHHSLPRS
jgi:hypothetical protein